VCHCQWTCEQPQAECEGHCAQRRRHRDGGPLPRRPRPRAPPLAGLVSGSRPPDSDSESRARVGPPGRDHHDDSETQPNFSNLKARSGASRLNGALPVAKLEFASLGVDTGSLSLGVPKLAGGDAPDFEFPADLRVDRDSDGLGLGVTVAGPGLRLPLAP
jgi:hypothetical protein